MTTYTTQSVLGGWVTADETGRHIGPTFNKSTDCWNWQRDNLRAVPTMTPQAAAAIRLADLTPRVTRQYITKRLEAGDCPRGLYVLACILRAARAVDQKQPRGI